MSARGLSERDAAIGSTLTPAALAAALAPGGELSGSALAARFGVTRAAIWKQIGQLREAGLEVRAVAGRGYRLHAPVELLDAARIGAAIDAAAHARLAAIDVLWETDSTSSVLLRDAGEGSAPRAVLAEIQSRGRGRRGRAWRMPLGAGIALSLVWRFDAAMAALAGLSLVAGIAVVRALGDVGVGEVALKWPNDVIARGRKLAGILVELGGEAHGPCRAVIGIGLNIRIGAEAGAGIDQPWIDLAALADGAPARNLVAGRVLSRLVEALDAFAHAGFAGFAHEFERHDALRDRVVRIESAGGPWTGVARGVDARGALRVERDGVEIAIDSGEVSVRADDPGASA